MARERKDGQELTIDALVESAILRFNSQRTFVNEQGRVEGYHIGIAAADAIDATGIPVIEVFRFLVGQTKFTPEDVVVEGSNLPMDDWNSLIRYSATAILEREATERHPEILPEDTERIGWKTQLPSGNSLIDDLRRIPGVLQVRTATEYRSWGPLAPRQVRDVTPRQLPDGKSPVIDINQRRKGQ